MAFANAGGNPVPAALNKFTISLPKGAKFNGAGAPQCKATDAELDAKLSAACPANTFVGTGKATAVPPGGGNTDQHHGQDRERARAAGSSSSSRWAART